VCYCIQTTVDADYNIPIDYLTTNKNDAKAMGPMLKRAVEIIGHNKFTALYDKGYHTGSELKAAVELGINAIVSAPDLASTSRAPSEAYNVQHFSYSTEKDLYICQQGQELTTNQSWHTNTRTRTKFKQYKTKACLSCKVKSLCTKSKTGKLISRSDHQQYYEANKQKLEQNIPLYRCRQAIVEHPYGSIKRYRGFRLCSDQKRYGKSSCRCRIYVYSLYTQKNHEYFRPRNSKSLLK